MKTEGMCGQGSHSNRDQGLPLPARTSSGRDIWSAYEAQGTRVSPLQIRSLTAEQDATLTARTTPKAARPRKPLTAPSTRRSIDPAQVIALYASGLTVPQIGAQIGFAANSVRCHLSHAGVFRDARKVRRSTADPATIVAAYLAGASIAAIRVSLHVGRHTIHRYLDAADVARRVDRPGPTARAA